MNVFIGLKKIIVAVIDIHKCFKSNEIKFSDDSTKFQERFNRTGASYMLHTYCMLRAGL